MRDVLRQLQAWWSAGERIGLASVISTTGSSPAGPGAAMAVGPDGEVAGSVSGGCVEAAVYELCERARETGLPMLRRYGVSQDTVFDVGLTCGGTLEVFAERIDRDGFPGFGRVAADVAGDRPVAVATLVRHPRARLGGHLVVADGEVTGELDDPGLDGTVVAAARRLLAEPGGDRLLRYGAETAVFLRVFAPRPRMLIVGATDFAASLAMAGSLLGYRVTVCDARPAFTTPARFPGAEEVVARWPDRYLAEEASAGRIDGRSAVCVLTHDPKFDVPVLQVALTLGRLAYVGAMGSRRTHDDRWRRLKEAGVTDDQLARLRSPIGLDLGGRSPQETAVSIVAEIIADRWAGTGLPLGETHGRIHGF